MCACVSVCMCVCAFVFMCVHACVCVCVHMCIHVYAHLYMHVCVCARVHDMTGSSKGEGALTHRSIFVHTQSYLWASADLCRVFCVLTKRVCAGRAPGN